MWFKRKPKSSADPAIPAAKGLLCFDFDGTMVDSESDPRFHPNLTDRLLKLERAGYAWAIVTGRALQQTLDALAGYGVMRVPHFIVAEEFEIHLRVGGSWMAVKEWNRACASLQKTFLRQNRKLFRRWQREIPAHVEAEMFMKPEGVGIVASESDGMDQVCEWLERRRIEELPNLGFQRNGRFLRFTARGLGKGGAVAELGRTLGLPMEGIFVAGDNYNDLSMLELPGVRAACPVNAVEPVIESVRQRGGFVATRRASAGMIEALDRWYADVLSRG